MTTIPRKALSKVTEGIKLCFKNPTLLLALIVLYSALSVIAYMAAMPFATPKLPAETIAMLLMFPLGPFLLGLYFRLAAHNFNAEGTLSIGNYLKDAFALGLRRYFSILFANFFLGLFALLPLIPAIVLALILKSSEHPSGMLVLMFAIAIIAGVIGSVFILFRFTLTAFIIINEKLPLFTSFSHSAYRMYGLKKHYLLVTIFYALLALITLIVAALIFTLLSPVSLATMHPLILSLIQLPLIIPYMVISAQINYYFYIQTQDKE